MTAKRDASIRTLSAKDKSYKNDDTFEIKFTRHVSVVQRLSSVESRINLKLHLNL